jgi:putative hydrolase of the HAD superfamily
MILFDYGQTLIAETNFNGLNGYETILKYAKKNPYKIAAKNLLDFETEFNLKSGRYCENRIDEYLFEIHDHKFLKLLHEYFKLEFDISLDELGNIFWDSCFEYIKPTPNIQELLKYLKESNIRTGVISNISYSENSLRARIAKYLPNEFEFIITSSEYSVRKPDSILFNLALRKANLEAKDVWYCGDSPFCDIEGASKANIFPVWYVGAISEKKRKVEPKCEYLKVTDWIDLIHVLQS